jgi:hypothetical protein
VRAITSDTSTGLDLAALYAYAEIGNPWVGEAVLSIRYNFEEKYNVGTPTLARRDIIVTPGMSGDLKLMPGCVWGRERSFASYLILDFFTMLSRSKAVTNTVAADPTQPPMYAETVDGGGYVFSAGLRQDWRFLPRQSLGLKILYDVLAAGPDPMYPTTTAIPAGFTVGLFYSGSLQFK